MITKTIKFNIKIFLEELYISVVSNEEDEVEEHISRFNKYYSNASEELKQSTFNYMQKSRIVRENNKVKKLLSLHTGRKF